MTVGTGYEQVVEASGGSSGYEWTVSAFALPTGLTLSTLGDAAVILGIPTVVQDATFTLRVTSSDGPFATMQLSIDVVPAQQRQAN